ncbi:MAG: hypothetical protein R8G33_02550 [Gammaproteobacteria bacterium]|nr:hypothetical protein [Gammaproteobacteria bacterium]
MTWSDETKYWWNRTKDGLRNTYGYNDPEYQEQTTKAISTKQRCLKYLIPSFLLILLIPQIKNNPILLLVPILVTVVAHIFSIRRKHKHRLLAFAPYWSGLTLIIILLTYLSLMGIISTEALILAFLGIIIILTCGTFYAGMK